MKCVRSSQISLGFNTRDDSMSDLEPCHLILYVTGACCRLNREFELMPGPQVSSMLTSAHECSRMLTNAYAHECSRMHVRCSASTLRMAQYTLQSAHVGSSQISLVIGHVVMWSFSSFLWTYSQILNWVRSNGCLGEFLG